jgi:hypothetical protein
MRPELITDLAIPADRHTDPAADAAGADDDARFEPNPAASVGPPPDLPSGCLLNCGYCVRHLVRQLSDKGASGVAAGSGSVRAAGRYQFLRPDQTPIQLLNRAPTRCCRR